MGDGMGKRKRVAFIALSMDENGEMWATVRRYPSRMRFDLGPAGTFATLLDGVWRALRGEPQVRPEVRGGRPLGRPE